MGWFSNDNTEIEVGEYGPEVLGQMLGIIAGKTHAEMVMKGEEFTKLLRKKLDKEKIDTSEDQEMSRTDVDKLYHEILVMVNKEPDDIAELATKEEEVDGGYIVLTFDSFTIIGGIEEEDLRYDHTVVQKENLAIKSYDTLSGKVFEVYIPCKGCAAIAFLDGATPPEEITPSNLSCFVTESSGPVIVESAEELEDKLNTSTPFTKRMRLWVSRT